MESEDGKNFSELIGLEHTHRFIFFKVLLFFQLSYIHSNLLAVIEGCCSK